MNNTKSLIAMFLLSFMVLSCTDDDKDVMDESGGSQSLFFAEEGLMVSTTGGDVVATVNWSNTTWRIEYDEQENAVVSSLSQSAGGSLSGSGQTAVTIRCLDNPTGKNRSQSIYLVAEANKERIPLLLTQPGDYLNSLAPLKSYVNRTTDPDFKLGTGVNAANFLKQDIVYTLTRSNFDEMTAGNAMKYGSVVQSDGTMDFTRVKNFVQLAERSNMSVYGHVLCWHAQTRKDYLYSLIEPEFIPGEHKSGKYIIDFESDNVGVSYPMTGNSSAIVEADPDNESGSVLHVGNDEVAAQRSYPKFEVTLPEGTKLGDYLTLSVDFRGNWNKGQTGSGMRFGINENSPSKKFNTPAGFGCPDGKWGRGLIKINMSDLNLTEEQKELTEFTLLLGSETGTGNYYIDNITMDWSITTGDQTIVKDPQEKVRILSDALERWMAGMVDACGGYVKTWELLNEPMQDWPDPTQLKTGMKDGVDVNKDNTQNSNFYWQDFLGKDYAVKALEFARKHGGEDIKLFVNEYGLEGIGSKKLQGFLDYVKYIDDTYAQKFPNSRGVDGIATQMHVSYYLDAAKQVEFEASIENMFTKLAATGKLVKISELDMGLVAEDGTDIMTADVTEEQHRKMADFYTFIIKKYFEIIPQPQRYGITQWCQTDAPVTSGWRGGQPVGIWDLDYNRKLIYEGYVNGLKQN